MKKIYLKKILVVVPLFWLSCQKQDVSLPKEGVEDVVVSNINSEETFLRNIATKEFIKIHGNRLRASDVVVVQNLETMKNDEGRELHIANFKQGGFLLFANDSLGRVFPIGFSQRGCLNSSDTVGNPSLGGIITKAFGLQDTELPNMPGVNPKPDLEPKAKYFNTNHKYESLINPSVAVLGQGVPFNWETSTNAAGCGVTAIAMIFSRYNYPKSIKQYDIESNSCKWKNIPWELIKRRNLRDDLYGADKGHPVSDSVLDACHSMSALFRQINKDCVNDIAGFFGHAMVRKEVIRDYFREKGFRSSLREYKSKDVLQYMLSKKIPVVMYGWSAFWSRHYWVLDGIMRYSYDVYRENPPAPDPAPAYQYTVNVHYVYCNWGWSGTGNGYYWFECFDPTEEVQIPQMKGKGKSDNDEFNRELHYITAER
ncbi:MAG: C10 family peptidase [Porphyromonas sp.]|nr:C10 family peptidase [Porphyromonas sp.]